MNSMAVLLAQALWGNVSTAQMIVTVELAKRPLIMFGVVYTVIIPKFHIITRYHKMRLLTLQQAFQQNNP